MNDLTIFDRHPWLVIPIALPLAFVLMALIGMTLEGMANHYEQLDRCQRQAVTPYEYHQCR